MVTLLLRADGTDDVRAERRGELNTRAPDTACGRGDEHPRVGSQDDLTGERDPGREIREDERGTLLERRRGGKVEQPVVLDGDLLCVPTALHAREADHATAVVGRAGDLGAGHVRQRRRLWVAALADQHVGVVDAGRADLDERLPGPGDRLRDIS